MSSFLSEIVGFATPSLLCVTAFYFVERTCGIETWSSANLFVEVSLLLDALASDLGFQQRGALSAAAQFRRHTFFEWTSRFSAIAASSRDLPRGRGWMTHVC